MVTYDINLQQEYNIIHELKDMIIYFESHNLEGKYNNTIKNLEVLINGMKNDIVRLIKTLGGIMLINDTETEFVV